METRIAIFRQKEIRKTVHNNEWWFSIIDVIEALTGTERPRKYWNDLKKKSKNEGYSEVSENIGQLKLVAPDGEKREKAKAKEKKLEKFRCVHCREIVPTGGQIGTEHRNHCPLCLWSKHVDQEKPGDRKSKCKSSMEPIGFTFKQEGFDKYGNPKQGELMLVHKCSMGDKICINRIAADDDSLIIFDIFKKSQELDSKDREELDKQGIKVLDKNNEAQISAQLFGRKH